VDNVVVDAAYAVEAWKDFAVMIGGASAALAGLLIVAMSINVEQILRYEYLPSRAAAALVTVLSPLIIAILLLVPDQPHAALGTELILLGLALGWVLLGRLARFEPGRNQSAEQWFIGTSGPMGVLTGGLVLAGVGISADAIGGLLWLAPAVIAAVLGGTTQAWVLLIEIRR